MSRFIQLHLLVSYPPSNLNRDDTGRPKTAVVGEANRLRISSQSLKRAWRTSDIFEEKMKGHIGIRTKEMGVQIYNELLKNNVPEKNAKEWIKSIMEQFGKLKVVKDAKNHEDLHIEQLVHFSTEEQDKVMKLIEKLSASGKPPSEEDLKLLTKQRNDVDIAMFGRMLAATPAYNVEAAVQVAHAITIHKVAVEDDYFSAVDDLNCGEDMGAAHIGESSFGAGVFYLYLCINRELLQKNLGDDQALMNKALEALVHSATKIPPTGKQSSFASRAYAAYALAEKGDQQPRSLVQAFLKPITGTDLLERGIKELNNRVANFDKVYGPCANGERYAFNVEKGEGSLDGLIKYVIG
ncbi:MAG: type I-E CRISPR-associated protein Cas7/Cse4/CasC [Gammaproteobacteria bacterium]|nr:type I-E CRISPR-associated protein Cas7/Cse4/CasC [Gammaproteobacteria bacterium]